MAAFRDPANPILTPQDVTPSRGDFEVLGVFNPAVARLGEEIVLLVRVAERPIQTDPEVVQTAFLDPACGRIVTKAFTRPDPANDFSDPRLIVRRGRTYLTSISHLRVARSKDGIRFTIDEHPTLGPADPWESFGVEDPRITRIGQTYYISYVAVSPLGVTTALASTCDFATFERHGVIFGPENKDVVLFPETVDGRYYALHRPHSPLCHTNNMWIAESPDLLCWGRHRHLMGLRDGFWDEARIGAGAPPVRLDEGWLEIYHGADRNHRYCLGAVLLDARQPWMVRARSARPILEPQTEYECSGFFGPVVFTCGLLVEQTTLKVYYGASDTTVCCAALSLEDVLASMQS
ncbi:MAG TPA: glycoside hydrolase family 130 protein [Sedimentisphaerales bacterium]|nr:glycoside hydrolase family 130 protein [Sedimentisphaerales bacterium]HRS13085.1 glycoside hydrolase family 130 protein [Sedimentisphaerales bacterium]HRV46419.1 glycoside hydrolase family 130 protein [Sedimentisphaerales bacterium]